MRTLQVPFVTVAIALLLGVATPAGAQTTGTVTQSAGVSITRMPLAVTVIRWPWGRRHDGERDSPFRQQVRRRAGFLWSVARSFLPLPSDSAFSCSLAKRLLTESLPLRLGL